MSLWSCCGFRVRRGRFHSRQNRHTPFRLNMYITFALCPPAVGAGGDGLTSEPPKNCISLPRSRFRLKDAANTPRGFKRRNGVPVDLYEYRVQKIKFAALKLFAVNRIFYAEHIYIVLVNNLQKYLLREKIKIRKGNNKEERRATQDPRRPGSTLSNLRDQ